MSVFLVTIGMVLFLYCEPFMLLLVNVVSYLLFPIRLTLLFTFSSLKLCNSVSDILLLQHFIL